MTTTVRAAMCMLGLIGVAVAGCGSSTVVEEGSPAGTNGGACYGNGSCNAGLACMASICSSAADAAAGDSTSSDTAPVGDTPPASDSAAPDSAATDASSTDAPAISDAPATADANAADAAASEVAAPPYVTTTITAACEDLGGTFEVSGVAADDSASNKTALPFAFSFFGTPVTQWSMSSNGFAQLWASSSGGTSTAATNVTIPTADQPNGFVAPFWDDLEPVFSNARATSLGAAPNRRFVIEWRHWTTKGDNNNRVSFEVKLYETTNVIEFHYCGMAPAESARANGSSATVGLESISGSAGILHAFNVANSVATNKALRFTP